jgi:aminomethyltransferase
MNQHLATRRALGVFDFSFMSLCEIAGGEVPAFLEQLQTRSIAALEPGRIVYTLLLRDDGSVFIDATLWRHADGEWWLFTGRRSDVAWIGARAAGFDVRIRDRSGELAVLALQGPTSGAVLARFAGTELVRSLRYFHFVRHGRTVIGRLGFSGELGYEIVLPPSEASTVRKEMLRLGALECSFEAADSLRIESGYVLFEREIDGRANPRELGLERLVSAPRARFPLSRQLVGLEIASRTASPLLPLARVTSECDSPILLRRIGLGFASPQAAVGSTVRLADGRLARIARLPFYDPGRHLPRATPL